MSLKEQRSGASDPNYYIMKMQEAIAHVPSVKVVKSDYLPLTNP